MASSTRRAIIVGALFLGGVLQVQAQQQQAVAPAIAPQAVEPVAAPAPVAVPTPTLTPGVHTIGDLDRIQSELIIAQARKQLAEAKKALADAQGIQGPVAEAAPLTPVVVGVYGTQAQPYARFLLGAGAEAVGRPGDVLPGDFRVVSVSVEKVVIKDRRGRSQIARFSATPPEHPAAAPATPTQGATR